MQRVTTMLYHSACPLHQAKVQFVWTKRVSGLLHHGSCVPVLSYPNCVPVTLCNLQVMWATGTSRLVCHAVVCQCVSLCACHTCVTPQVMWATGASGTPLQTLSRAQTVIWLATLVAGILWPLFLVIMLMTLALIALARLSSGTAYDHPQPNAAFTAFACFGCRRAAHEGKKKQVDFVYPPQEVYERAWAESGRVCLARSLGVAVWILRVSAGTL